MPKTTYLNLPAERQQELIQRALGLFTEREYANITMEDITKRLDLPTGTFYRYFKDKEDLFLTVLQRHAMGSEISEDYIETPTRGWDVDYLDQRGLMLVHNIRNAPEEIVRAYYFGPYRERMYKEYYRDLLNMKFAGEVYEDLDVDLISFMYTTTAYNLIIYFREKGLTDIKDAALCDNIMRYFYYTFFMRGIRKPGGTPEKS